MPFKTLILPLTASLALHALLAASFYSPGGQKEIADSKFIDISYVHYAPEKKIPLPKIQYSPVVKDLQILKEPSVSIKIMPHALNAHKADSLFMKSSEELLADPQKGKIFLNYFGLVKQRVRHAVEEGFSRGSLGHGNVTLYFVLKSDGVVVQAFAINESSSAEPSMKDFAVRCVRESSPFPHFPKELNMQRISFNLSILFDETN